MPGPRRKNGQIPEGAFAAGKRTPRQVANAEVGIALVKAAARLMDQFSAILKPVDLSPPQFNVLRILRGAGPQGATCGEVIDRLVQRDPDVTRLHDRLQRRGLIERKRDEQDRRVVRTSITAAGLELLASLDDAVNELHAKSVGQLNDRQLADLRKLIEEIQR